MQSIKVYLEIIVSIAAIWGAVLSSYAFFHKQSSEKPILTTAIEIKAKKGDNLVKYAKLRLFVTNTGEAPIELKAHPIILLINPEKKLQNRFVLSNNSDVSARSDDIQLPILLKPGDVALYATAYYPFADVMNPLNGYAVILHSESDVYVSYTPHPKNVKGIMMLMNNPLSQKYFGNLKTYAVRAYVQ